MSSLIPWTGFQVTMAVRQGQVVVTCKDCLRIDIGRLDAWFKRLHGLNDPCPGPAVPHFGN